MRLRPDQVVDGRYRLIERIGSGGMADVWRAHDAELGRDVAIKVLHENFARDTQFVERFRREASSAAGLQHPNVVSVYDRGEWEGTYYIAMELVEGSLAARPDQPRARAERGGRGRAAGARRRPASRTSAGSSTAT